jgi:hypothetical protein
MSYTPAQMRAYRKKVTAGKQRKTSLKSSSGHVTYLPLRVIKPAPPRPATVRGRGNYQLKYPGVGKAIGESIGAPFGMSALGGLIGNGAHHLLKYVTGFGDYRVYGNSLMGGGMTPPQIINSVNRNGVIMRHREYIADILCTTAFTIQTFDINPALATSFPWLSQVADSFEQYQFRGLIFEFKSLSSDSVVSTNATAGLGAVIMATQYNSISPVFPDKKTMENYEFANSAKPSECFIHPIECKRSATPVDLLYCRTGAIPTGSDQRLYDLGQFSIATSGMQSSTGTCGELWATFEVELYKPKLVGALGYELLTDHWQLPITGVSGAAPFGTAATAAPVLVAGSNLNTTITATAGVYTHINFPANMSDGKYLGLCTWTGTAAACTTPILSATNATFLVYWQNDGSANINPSAGTTTNILTVAFLINITGANALVTFGAAGTLPTTVTSGDLWICQFNGDIAG